MMDYALKPPSSTQEINIEKINSTNDYLSLMNPDDQKLLQNHINIHIWQEKFYRMITRFY